VKIIFTAGNPKVIWQDVARPLVVA